MIQLLENGLVVHWEMSFASYVIRRFDPNEVIDSKWDVLGKHNQWGAAAGMALPGFALEFDKLEKAIEHAYYILPVKRNEHTNIVNNPTENTLPVP